MQNEMNERPLVCNLGTIDEQQRPEHERNTRELFAEIDEVRELDEGYAFRIPAHTDSLVRAARFMALERRCCPFFEFSISVQSNDGPGWLELRGTPRIKQFIRDNVLPTMRLAQGQSS